MQKAGPKSKMVFIRLSLFVQDFLNVCPAQSWNPQQTFATEVNVFGHKAAMISQLLLTSGAEYYPTIDAY